MLKNFDVIDILNTRSKSVVNIHGNTLKFNLQTASELEYPQYVEFLINAKEKQFAIRRCKEENPNAIPFFKEEDKRKVVVSHPVIVGLVRRMAGWGADENWDVPGIYDFDEKALIYPLKAAEQPKPNKGGRKKSNKIAGSVTEKGSKS